MGDFYVKAVVSVTFEILKAVSEEKEMNADLAIKCAILHDSIEDTEQSYEGIKNIFGEEVANGVMALTKNESLDSKDKMMLDSLSRIKQQPKEVWTVKMADRIYNLYAPPCYWTNEKKIKYKKEAQLIHDELKDGNKYYYDNGGLQWVIDYATEEEQREFNKRTGLDREWLGEGNHFNEPPGK